MKTFNILAATLGLVLATGAFGVASASPSTEKAPVAQSEIGKTVVGKTSIHKKVASKHHRLHLARHGHQKMVRATTRAKLAHKIGLKHLAQAKIGKSKTSVIR